ncbi:MAG: tetraacyldisaccharide 4'-kinase [Flavobacteriaceae bacterium TMED120]|nr:MAG: tetraacyldisaccharide 4'-kinase [Flavobacteriaceae bacterium TMED120]
MKLVRFLLFPIALLYGLVMSIRNLLFHCRIWTPRRFQTPLIGVGNLATGGTGKSVVIDYLLTAFKKKFRLAVLSRGYGRSSKGFVLGKADSTASALGDEPFQFSRKHPEVTVAVAEKRVEGVEHLLNQFSKTEAILLDDVMQHRWIQPHLLVLTTTFNQPYSQDFVLPMGNLREWRKGARRADIILITKTPPKATSADRDRIKQSLKLASNQSVYFCATAYAKFIDGAAHKPLVDIAIKKFILVTGIADAAPLVSYLKGLNFDFEHLEYPDHYAFSKATVGRIEHKAQNTFILTTEKDFGRLQPLISKKVLLYYLPIQLKFLNAQEEQAFLLQIEDQLQ